MKLSDLKNPDREIREKAWKELVEIFNNSQAQRFVKEKRFFRSLLWFPLQGVREDAWNHLDIYKMLSVEGIERTLAANSDKIRISAWEKVGELIKYDIVPKHTIIAQKQYFWRLLRSYYPTIRKKAWKLFPRLIDDGIFSDGDVKRFVEFLEHKKPSVRIFAWKTVPILLEKGFLKRENIEAELKYLEELLVKDSKIKKTALKIIKMLREEGK